MSIDDFTLFVIFKWGVHSIYHIYFDKMISLYYVLKKINWKNFIEFKNNNISNPTVVEEEFGIYTFS